MAVMMFDLAVLVIWDVVAAAVGTGNTVAIYFDFAAVLTVVPCCLERMRAVVSSSFSV